MFDNGLRHTQCDDPSFEIISIPIKRFTDNFSEYTGILPRLYKVFTEENCEIAHPFHAGAYSKKAYLANLGEFWKPHTNMSDDSEAV